MSKYFNAGLVFLYVVVTIYCFLLVLVLSGIRIPDKHLELIIAGWLVFCFGSAYFLTDLYFFFRYHLRRPTRPEEEKLVAAFHAVRERAGYKKAVKLRVHESGGWNAFAIGTQTIAVSKGMLADLTDDELKGVLAHELGHLVSYDTVVVAAYVTAGYLPRVMGFVYRWIAAIARSGFRKRYHVLPGIIRLLIFGAILYFLHLQNAIIAIILFTILFAVLAPLFRFLTLLLMRVTEYRQDAFAQQLGYGKGLRDVLEKMTYKAEHDVNPYYIVFNSNHPIIYNRIRRLEELEV
jgi:heat shock protein HtpX